jgi:hypothetical protein
MTEKENRAKGDDQKDYPRADDLPVHEIKSEYGAKKAAELGPQNTSFTYFLAE